MANVIQALNKPTLIIAHNKTLAGQLYGEFKEFFPNNAMEYFVSYYEMGVDICYLMLSGAIYTTYCGLYGLYGQGKTVWTR